MILVLSILTAEQLGNLTLHMLTALCPPHSRALPNINRAGIHAKTHT